MIFNENQHFYAALWWTAQLPGGADQVSAILARHGKNPVTFPAFAPKKNTTEEEARSFRALFAQIEGKPIPDEPETPITPDMLDQFFDALYDTLKWEDRVDHTGTGRHPYIELRRSCATSSDNPAYPDYPYSEPLEVALAVADIPRHALPVNGHCCIHHDGQLMVARENPPGKYFMHSMDYPDRPSLPYHHIDMHKDDMGHCPKLIWETPYRVVPLQPGQPFHSGWMTVGGDRHFREQTAGENRVLCIGSNDVNGNLDLLRTLTDREIIDGHLSLTGSIDRNADEMKPGFQDSYYKNKRILPGDRPGMVREQYTDIAFMNVKTTTQMGWGGSFTIAEPGDFIIRETENSLPRVIRKELIDSRRVIFILPPDEPKRGPKAPGLN